MTNSPNPSPTCTACGGETSTTVQIRHQITTVGCAVLAVDNGPGAPYTYTVGLTEHGKPELYISGGTPLQGASLLLRLATTYTGDHDLVPGQYVTAGEHAAHLKELPNTALLALAHDYYPHQVTALEVIPLTS